MQSRISHTACGLALLVAVSSSERTARQNTVWQADIQIRTLEVTQTKRSMSVRVVIYTENDDEARNARLLFLLPVGVGIERLGTGCIASPGPSNVPALRAAVTCDLGGIPNHGFREVAITTTLPTEGLAKRIGVFAYSATPDPVPGNNYAERIVP
ncbi:MAG TPA: hypothetical protein VJ717_15855 [Gemmatimonadaceae bacterium]|nr:hypothetical protein [Gemmatimonadaceae bacterium]